MSVVIDLVHMYSSALRSYPADLSGQQRHYAEFLPTISLDLCVKLQNEFSETELTDLRDFLSILLEGGTP